MTKNNFLTLLLIASISLVSFSAANDLSNNPATTASIGNDCDQIILRTGDIINGKVIEIGTTEIKYKNCDHLDGPTISIFKKNVLSIKYTNGKVDKITQDPASLNAGSDNANNVFANGNGLAIASFSAGILACILAFILPSILGLLLAILAIIFAIVVLGKIKKMPDVFKGKTMATWGLVLAILSGVILAFLVALGS